jgi:hypothetical protein
LRCWARFHRACICLFFFSLAALCASDSLGIYEGCRIMKTSWVWHIVLLAPDSTVDAQDRILVEPMSLVGGHCWLRTVAAPSCRRGERDLIRWGGA